MRVVRGAFMIAKVPTRWTAHLKTDIYLGIKQCWWWILVQLDILFQFDCIKMYERLSPIGRSMVTAIEFCCWLRWRSMFCRQISSGTTTLGPIPPVVISSCPSPQHRLLPAAPTDQTGAAQMSPHYESCSSGPWLASWSIDVCLGLHFFFFCAFSCIWV